MTVKSNCDGAGETLHISSPIGPLKLVVCTNGVHELGMSESQSMSSKQISFETKQTCDRSPTVEQSLLWLKAYFERVSPLPETPKICLLSGNLSSFRPRVLDSLRRRVGFGSRVTYSSLATIANNPGAARAVGSAMRNNPVMLMVPCHRVVRADGSLGRFAGGRHDAVKDALLRHESGAEVLSNPSVEIL